MIHGHDYEEYLRWLDKTLRRSADLFQDCWRCTGLILIAVDETTGNTEVRAAVGGNVPNASTLVTVLEEHVKEVISQRTEPTRN